MTPEQLKQKLFEEIFKNQHQKVDTEEGESNEEEEKSTTSSDKSEQNSDSDITTEDEQEKRGQSISNAAALPTAEPTDG